MDIEKDNLNINYDTVYLTVYPGVGGADAKDWSHMLLEMYFKYAIKNKWTCSYINENTLEIKSKDAYYKLKNEAGVHRLIRISPFDAKKLRHTSFALVEVLPQLSKIDEDKINIPEKDLKFEFSRSGGPGGQNVNKVETAVRVVHLLTGISASSQSERSQARNREKALSLLKAKIAQVLKEKQEKEVANLKTRVEPEWGNEIRSYVLYPYKQVKDHRTGFKSSKVEEVLDGNLDIIK
jgi:peptide chain release factor 2